MLIGCFIRGYKVYSNVNFVSLVNEKDQSLSIFIGENGVGKSSVLEALDVSFNNRKWNYNIGSKKSEAFICPVFLIKKNECTIKSKALPHVSDYFWQYQIPSAGSVVAYEGMEKFVEFRKTLLTWASPSDYYLVCVGVDSEGGTFFTSTLDKKIRSGLRTKGVSYTDLDDLRDSIYSEYRYIYLPVEVTTKEILDIQSLELQGLMDKNLVSEIENILKTPRGGVSSIVDDINDRLDLFLAEINKKLDEDGYLYATPVIGQKKVSASDIVGGIIDSYFANRSLQKDKKLIGTLSSGEQRRALLDVAYAFISNGRERQKKLIIGIDEPEASLHTKVCYEQFKKIFAVSEAHDCQVVISTHWYGLLMTSQKAVLHHITNDNAKIDIKSFDLHNIHESRRGFPDSVSMKSFFDLVSSILSILKGSGGRWIICEGSDDKNFLANMLGNKISDLTILPVGGAANVIKLFNYFKMAVQDKSERPMLKGKILCLIDSDAVRIEVNPCTSAEEKNILRIKRFQIQNDQPILVDPTNSGLYTETELEDCLPPEDYFRACKEIIESEYTELTKNYNINTASPITGINYDMKFLSPKTKKGYEDKHLIKAIVTNARNKYLVSEKYIPVTTPAWIDEIANFLV